MELSLRSSTPGLDNHAPQTIIPPRGGNHVFSAAATPSAGQQGVCQQRLWRNCPFSACPLLGGSHAPSMEATPSKDQRGLQAPERVELKCEAAFARLLPFGGSHAPLRRQFRPLQHRWGCRACPPTAITGPALTPPLSPPPFLSFIHYLLFLGAPWPGCEHGWTAQRVTLEKAPSYTILREPLWSIPLELIT